MVQESRAAENGNGSSTILTLFFTTSLIPLLFIAYWIAPKIGFTTIPSDSTYRWLSPSVVLECRRYPAGAILSEKGQTFKTEFRLLNYDTRTVTLISTPPKATREFPRPVLLADGSLLILHTWQREAIHYDPIKNRQSIIDRKLSPLALVLDKRYLVDIKERELVWYDLLEPSEWKRYELAAEEQWLPVKDAFVLLTQNLILDAPADHRIISLYGIRDGRLTATASWNALVTENESVTTSRNWGLPLLAQLASPMPESIFLFSRTVDGEHIEVHESTRGTLLATIKTRSPLANLPAFQSYQEVIADADLKSLVNEQLGYYGPLASIVHGQDGRYHLGYSAGTFLEATELTRYNSSVRYRVNAYRFPFATPISSWLEDTRYTSISQLDPTGDRVLRINWLGTWESIDLESGEVTERKSVSSLPPWSQLSILIVIGLWSLSLLWHIRNGSMPRIWGLFFLTCLAIAICVSRLSHVGDATYFMRFSWQVLVCVIIAWLQGAVTRSNRELPAHIALGLMLVGLCLLIFLLLTIRMGSLGPFPRSALEIGVISLVTLYIWVYLPRRSEREEKKLAVKLIVCQFVFLIWVAGCLAALAWLWSADGSLTVTQLESLSMANSVFLVLPLFASCAALRSMFDSFRSFELRRFAGAVMLLSATFLVQWGFWSMLPQFEEIFGELFRSFAMSLVAATAVCWIGFANRRPTEVRSQSALG